MTIPPNITPPSTEPFTLDPDELLGDDYIDNLILTLLRSRPNNNATTAELDAAINEWETLVHSATIVGMIARGDLTVELAPNGTLAVAIPEHAITADGRHHPKVGRNEPCPCGSALKAKRCCHP